MSDTPSGTNRQWLVEGQRDLVPRPDPTKLTTDIVNAAKADLRNEAHAQRELLETRIAGVDALIATLVRQLSELNTFTTQGLRDAADSQTKAFQQSSHDRIDDIREAIGHLKDLHEERFNAIAQQFSERDVRGEQEKKTAQEALSAALLAQKESVAQQNDANTTAATKSETSFTKQIDQIGTLIATLEKSLTDRITELKERIDRGEGQSNGTRDSRAIERVEIGNSAAVSQAESARRSVWVAVAAIGGSVIIGFSGLGVAAIIR